MTNDIPSARSPWTVVAGSALALTVCAGPVIQFSFAVFIKPLAAALHTDRGVLSLAPALGLLLMGLFTPVLGLLMDRHGMRRIVPIAIVLVAAFVAMLGRVQTPVGFIALYCLAGVALAGFSPLPFAKAVSAAFRTRRGLALGITMAGVGIGTALVPPLAQALITGFGWRLAYVGLGATVLVMALPATLLTLPDLKIDRAAPAAVTFGATAGETLRDGVFWKLAIAFGLVALATNGFMTHVVALLSDRGIATGVAAAAISLGGVALIVGRLLSGYLLDKVFAPRVALGFFAVALVGTALLFTSTTAAIGWLATALVGLSIGAEIDLIAFLICRYFGQRAFGALYGYLFLAFTLGTALGPLSMGVVFTRTGNYNGALIGFMVGLVVACLLVLRLGPYRYRADGAPVDLAAPASVEVTGMGLTA